MRLHSVFALALCACCPPPPGHPTTAATGGGTGSGSAVVEPKGRFAAAVVTLDTLAPDLEVDGFKTVAVYVDAADQPIGARFVHTKTGFTLDYAQIESAPQGFIWVNSYPTSDKGEPHTQEHLLLGKGDRGRKMGSFQAMALAESSAFTDQWRTCYHFHTVAGHDVFWPVFEDQLDTLLNPDYTDEEIRREVRNFGVDKGDKGTLRLEEKGTVYNEMVRTYEAPDSMLWRTALRQVYGTHHPLSYESGGFPEAIRTMTAGDIRKFHDDAYHLANMGIVATFPRSMPLADVLVKTDAVLAKEAGRAGRVMSDQDLPRPAPAKPQSIEIVDYPYSDSANPGPIMFAWPATRDLDLTERTLLDLFLDAFAGDESTNLYKKLIDSKTRTIDLGANGVGANASSDQGEPVFVSLSGVKAEHLDAATVDRVRGEITAELARIAKLPDGDPELIAFDKRVASRVVNLRRRLAKFLDSPPGFGFRGTGSAWINQLHALERAPGFKKSITLKPELAKIESILAAGGNPWRARLASWGLLAVPYGVAARPSPELRKKIDSERTARADAELARLATVYQTKDAPATLARYQADYDAQTKQIEDAAKAVALPPLVASPPMTLDDELHYTTDSIGSVPAFRATIDSMQSARVSLAFSTAAVPEDDLMYLALLPALMSDVGLVENGTAIASDEVRERQRKEILELKLYYTHSTRTGRTELVVAGAGNDAAETKLAIGWMGRALFDADWRIENLARLRDVVDQAITERHQQMLGPEEAWVRDPHDAWWRQAWPQQLHALSFLTQEHDLHRLRWMLLDPGDAKVTAEVTALLATLADAGKLSRADQAKLFAGGKAVPARYATALAKLSAKAHVLGKAALADLAAVSPDLPDSSRAADWSYLCKEMAHDLGVGAPAALAKLASVRTAIVGAATARVIEIGSPRTETAIASELATLVGRLDKAPRAPQGYAPRRRIAERLRDHDPKALDPQFVGLLDPATSSGVFVNSAPSTALTDDRDDAALDLLSNNLYTGHGAHSLFMKTWAAGLAYSNGIHALSHTGEIEYYAERCPLLPQTLRFVIAQLKAAKPDANIARYAIATAFDSRIAEDYESRAAKMANDLVDGITPDVVRAFRRRILALAGRDDLAATLFDRMPAVYGKVLPGYGTPAPAGSAINFVIGPAKQLDAYQDYLHAAVGKSTTLYRLYPRDFWIPAKL